MPYRDADDARRVHLRLVESLTVETPCRESWNRMQGDERVRHCSRCSKNVFNLSAMSLEEIAALVERLQGNLCARFYRRPDGRLVTADCPPTDTARRASRIAGATAVAVGVAAAAALVAVPPAREAIDEAPADGLAPEEAYISVMALDANETLRESMGAVVISSAIDDIPVAPPMPTARETAIDDLLGEGANGEAWARPRAFYELPFECNRFTPAGSFDDAEIQDRAPRSALQPVYGPHGIVDGYELLEPCSISPDDSGDASD